MKRFIYFLSVAVAIMCVCYPLASFASQVTRYSGLVEKVSGWKPGRIMKLADWCMREGKDG
jgi:hypothetical protein